MGVNSWTKLRTDLVVFQCLGVLLEGVLFVVGSTSELAGPAKGLCPVTLFEQRPQVSLIPRDPNPTFWIEVEGDTYTPGIPLTVSIVGSKHFHQFALQAHSSTDGAPLGTWNYLPHGAETISCVQTSDTVVFYDKGRERVVKLEWTAGAVVQNVQFLANVLQGDLSQTKIVSKVIQPGLECNCSSPNDDGAGDSSVRMSGDQGHLEGPNRYKRDIADDVNATDTHVGPTKTTTSTTTTTTRKTPTTTTRRIIGSDVKDLSESLFLLATIIGAYVGMYTIFAFLIL